MTIRLIRLKKCPLRQNLYTLKKTNHNCVVVWNLLCELIDILDGVMNY